ncbi:ribosomal-protein-alanine acetyltransferase [Thermogladius calderae 1633]|uniref:Ribosomal-protein-alanine acetyltransferase n=1 Tax=Thermogladius calderae (strain DSM 22663 / VKM B-2946 / 1633) TaxID=1184251 RepID=I3TEK9_THEC1|nr:ribosomal protein S18-alanine N-acetyltransferase [Thermogladius calderae]AFK51197.1 ribosomal-protein-alanine acetyltransferase [Thermogladius calderae 1633]
MAVAGVEIRASREEDIPTLLEIERECFPPDLAYDRSVFEELFTIINGVVLVAEVGGRVIGYAAGVVEEGYGHVVSIAVAPSWQGKGVGSLLLEKLEEKLRGLGAACFVLEVAVDNERALRLYTKSGYRVVRVLKGYYGGRDGFLMVKGCLYLNEHA